MTDDPQHLRHATLEWTGRLAFRGGNAAGGPQCDLDPDGETGPSPMVALLMAVGGCAGADVASILEKMKVTLRRFTIDVTGRRNPDHPKRYNSLRLTFRLSGDGLTEANTRRAVELSVSKYCSVMLTLDPAMPIETAIEIV